MYTVKINPQLTYIFLGGRKNGKRSDTIRWNIYRTVFFFFPFTSMSCIIQKSKSNRNKILNCKLYFRKSTDYCRQLCRQFSVSFVTKYVNFPFSPNYWAFLNRRKTKSRNSLTLGEINKKFFSLITEIPWNHVRFQANLLPEFFRFLIKSYFYSVEKKSMVE